MRRVLLLLAVASLCLAPVATAEQYLLAKVNWKASDTAAVESAGGEIVYAHGPTGIAMVRSDSPTFLEDVQGVVGLQFAEQDLFVDWQQPPVDTQAVTPGDETFFPFQWNMLAIDAPSAWAAGCDGAGARVAVIDGGINDTHIDLAGQVDTACSASFVPPFPFNFDTSFFWHGTHVAGIVAAADNGLGTIGVAPNATIMALKALHSGSGSFGAVIGAILFAADPASFGPGCNQRADIINMSLSGAFFKGGAGGFHSLVNRAVNFAGSQGVLVISAAANNGVDTANFPSLIITPAMAGSGLAISATGPTGFINGATNFRRFASYSNYGEDLVDLAGPGGDFVDGPGFPFDMVLSPCGGLGGTFYCFAAGTSMAAPAAAGVAALIVGANPGISKGALKAQLKNTADDEGPNGKDKFYGHGFVNAFRACTE